MDVNPKIKTLVEELLCPLHGQHPSVEILTDNSILLTCCCAEFKIQCYDIIKKLKAIHEPAAL